MEMYGYYIHVYGKDCFIVTDAKKRSSRLAIALLNGVQNRLNRFINISADTVECVKGMMVPATLEVKTIENGKYKGLRYIDISGDGFSFGCDACENPYDKVYIFRDIKY